MNEQLLFRRAAAADIPRIMRIIARAQAQMRAAGSQQWQDGYPVESDIARDIGRGDGYVLSLPAADPAAGSAGSALPDRDSLPDTLPGGSAAGEAVAYGAAVFDGEPAYAGIEGRWLTDGAYVVLHRLAVAGGMQGRAGDGVSAACGRTGAAARGVRFPCGHQFRQPPHAASAGEGGLPFLRNGPLCRRRAAGLRETALTGRNPPCRPSPDGGEPDAFAVIPRCHQIGVDETLSDG